MHRQPMEAQYCWQFGGMGFLAYELSYTKKYKCICMYMINTLRLRQNGGQFADNIFKCIFLNEHFWIPIKISLKFVPKGRINNIPALVQIMVWHRPGDKPLSEPMMVSLLTHICINPPQWVNKDDPHCFLKKDWLLILVNWHLECEVFQEVICIFCLPKDCYAVFLLYFCMLQW